MPPKFLRQLRDFLAAPIGILRKLPNGTLGSGTVAVSEVDTLAATLATMATDGELQALSDSINAALALKSAVGHGHSSISNGGGSVSVNADGATLEVGSGLSRFLMRRPSSTGIARDAVSIDAIWTDATDATRSSSVSLSTVSRGRPFRERLLLGGSVGITNYALRVVHNEDAPNQSNVAAYFEAVGATVNVALKTGQGTVEFGGQVVFNNAFRIDAGLASFWGLRGAKGNLYIADKTNWVGAVRGNGPTLVFAGDERGQAANESHAFAHVRGVKENAAYLNRLGTLVFGTQTSVGGDGSIGLDSTVTDWMFLTSQGVLELKNTTAPTALTWGDGGLFVQGGALKYRGSLGTITQLAPP